MEAEGPPRVLKVLGGRSSRAFGGCHPGGSVSWIRRREAMNRMTKPWEETPEEFATRLKGVVQEINDTLNVDGLCRAFKQRVQKLVDRDGDRISH